MCQHFREHLDKLFAKGIGLLGEALTEAFMILSDVSSSKKKLWLTFNDKSFKHPLSLYSNKLTYYKGGETASDFLIAF